DERLEIAIAAGTTGKCIEAVRCCAFINSTETSMHAYNSAAVTLFGAFGEHMTRVSFVPAGSPRAVDDSLFVRALAPASQMSIRCSRCKLSRCVVLMESGREWRAGLPVVLSEQLGCSVAYK